MIYLNSQLLTNLKFTAFGYKYDLHFKATHTFLVGDSGVGKTKLFNAINSLLAINKLKDVVTVNYLTRNPNDLIFTMQRKLIVIDNADVILTQDLRAHIKCDQNNMYLIIGRNPKGLLLLPGNVVELHEDNKLITFDYFMLRGNLV